MRLFFSTMLSSIDGNLICGGFYMQATLSVGIRSVSNDSCSATRVYDDSVRSWQGKGKKKKNLGRFLIYN